MRKLIPIFVAIVLLVGCQREEGRSMKFSEDPSVLAQRVQIAFPFERVRWEIFTIPENRPGDVPGPVYEVLLIAVFDTDAALAPAQELPRTKVAPNAIKEWLPVAFQKVLQKASAGVTLQDLGCQHFEAIVRTPPPTPEQLRTLGYTEDDVARFLQAPHKREFLSAGFSCKIDKKVMIHLPVAPRSTD